MMVEKGKAHERRTNEIKRLPPNAIDHGGCKLENNGSRVLTSGLKTSEKEPGTMMNLAGDPSNVSLLLLVVK